MDGLLDRLGWSQAYLARRLEVSPKTVGNWVRSGAPRAVELYLEMCCRLLGV